MRLFILNICNHRNLGDLSAVEIHASTTAFVALGCLGTEALSTRKYYWN